MAALFMSGPAQAHQHHHRHLPGCNTARCDHAAVRACNAHATCRARVQRKAWHRVADPYWGTFQAIAECESHEDWQINTGNGYYGGLQFDLRTWGGVGGRGLPSSASKLEQIMRAVLVVRSRGDFGAWPVCRHAAGV